MNLDTHNMLTRKTVPIFEKFLNFMKNDTHATKKQLALLQFMK